MRRPTVGDTVYQAFVCNGDIAFLEYIVTEQTMAGFWADHHGAKEWQGIAHKRERLSLSKDTAVRSLLAKRLKEQRLLSSRLEGCKGSISIINQWLREPEISAKAEP